MVRSERYAGLFRVGRAAHALEHDRFLAEQIGDELGAVVIVDAEYLQDAGVRQEGAGAALVERAELVNVLQDRPALLQRLAAVRGRLSLCAAQAAAAKWWLSMPMASVSAEGPMPKALSTRHIGRASCRESVCPDD